MKFASRQSGARQTWASKSQPPLLSRGTHHNKVNGFAFDLDQCLIDLLARGNWQYILPRLVVRAPACVVQTYDAGMDWDDILRRPGTNPRAAQRAVTGRNRRVLKYGGDAACMRSDDISSRYKCR